MLLVALSVLNSLSRLQSRLTAVGPFLHSPPVFPSPCHLTSFPRRSHCCSLRARPRLPSLLFSLLVLEDGELAPTFNRDLPVMKPLCLYSEPAPFRNWIGCSLPARFLFPSSSQHGPCSRHYLPHSLPQCSTLCASICGHVFWTHASAPRCTSPLTWLHNMLCRHTCIYSSVLCTLQDVHVPPFHVIDSSTCPIYTNALFWHPELPVHLYLYCTASPEYLSLSSLYFDCHQRLSLKPGYCWCCFCPMCDSQFQVFLTSPPSSHVASLLSGKAINIDLGSPSPACVAGGLLMSPCHFKSLTKAF